MSSLVGITDCSSSVGVCCAEKSVLPETQVDASSVAAPVVIVSSVLEKACNVGSPKALPPVTQEVAPIATRSAEKASEVAALTKITDVPGESHVDKVGSPDSSRIKTPDAEVPAKPALSTEALKKTENVVSSEAPAPVLTKEEKEKIYVEAKKSEILARLNEWKKEFNPYPAFYLRFIPGIIDLAKTDAAEMLTKFTTKLAQAKTIADLRNVLKKNIEVMRSKLSKVNQATEDKIKDAIKQAESQLEALTPKKTARKAFAT